MKCSPLQIRHLTFLSLSLSFMLPCSTFSSLASFRQFALGRKMIFSPTDVVVVTGPGASLADSPNLAHDLRSATRGSTISLCVVSRIRRVVLIFLPASESEYEMMVLVPSLFEMVCGAGRSVMGVSSRSSSSAQSGRL